MASYNMPKSLIIVSVLAILVSCRTYIKTYQINDIDKIGVKSNRLKGTVFKNSYYANNLFINTLDSLKRFTPTENDIDLAERILKEQIREVNKRHINQIGKHQYIERNLTNYFRQYIGYINEKGDRTIHINFHWDRFTIMDRLKGYWDDRLDYTSDYSMVFDGGSRYWSINVNLSSKTLYGLSVNGIS